MADRPSFVPRGSKAASKRPKILACERDTVIYNDPRIRSDKLVKATNDSER
jgi:hypothetical protein